MKKLTFLSLTLVAAACNGTEPGDGPAPTLPGDAAPAQIDGFDRLQSSTRQRWSWTQDARRASMHLAASRTAAHALVVNAGSDPGYATLSLLAEHKSLFRMKSPHSELAMTKNEIDRLGMTHARFQQTVRGVPVVGAELMAHYDAGGHLTSIDSNYIADLDLDVTPRIAPRDALAKVKADVLTRSVALPSTLDADEGKLVVYSPPVTDGVAAPGGKLAYEYRVRAMEADEPAIWVTTVDAMTGEILHRYNDLQTVQGSGVGILGDTKTFEVTASSGGGFAMTDSSSGVQIRTLTARQEQTAPGTPITSTTATSWDTGVPGAGAAVDAHVNATLVFKYYKEKHARNAIDGVGGAMLSTAHYGRNFENAAWDSVGMFYGDGGTTLRPFSVAVDIVGHEFTHGVIEKTSQLIYDGQSGALNEAVADIMGAFVEHFVKPDDVKNWRLGETATRNGAPLRDMKDPGAVDDPQPAHMLNFLNTEQDNGGVHFNSGIVNNAAFLMTVGGTNPASNVAVKFGIGWEKSEELWYRANAQYFLRSTNFAQAAQGLLQAAKDIGLTENETSIVDCALKATGITDGACAPLGDPKIAAAPRTAVTDTDADSSDDEAPQADDAPKKRRLVSTEQAGSCSAAPGPSSLLSGAGTTLLALVVGAAFARRRGRYAVSSSDRTRP